MVPRCWPFLGFFSFPPSSRTAFYPWYLRQPQIQNSSALLGLQQLAPVHTMHSQENLQCTRAHGPVSLCAWSLCRWVFSALMHMEKTMSGQELQQCPAASLRGVQGAGMLPGVPVGKNAVPSCKVSLLSECQRSPIGISWQGC